MLGERRLGSRERGHPHRYVQAVQRARQYPPVAAVVPGARRHEHALPRGMREVAKQHGGGRAPSRFHQRGERDAGPLGAGIPGSGLDGREDGEERHRKVNGKR